MSRGVSRRSSSREQALSNSTGVLPTAMPRAPDETWGTRNSSWLRISRTTGISSFSTRARNGSSLDAFVNWPTTGKSIEVTRKFDPSHTCVVPPTVMRFSP